MTLRQKLACVGLTVFGLQIASAAAGGAPLADRLRLWLDPEQLLAASVRMELGAPPVDVSPTPEAAAALSAARPRRKQHPPPHPTASPPRTPRPRRPTGCRSWRRASQAG